MIPAAVPVGRVPITPFASLEDASVALLPADKPPRSFAVAINAEKLVRLRSSPDLEELIATATVRYADGMPIARALRRKGSSDAIRIPGCDLWETLMRRAADLGAPVFLVGARPQVLRTVQQRLTSEIGVKVVGAAHGFFDDPDVVIREIARSGARVVSVAMGTPMQELFIQRARAVCDEPLFIGVGGTYDVYAGAVKRAPRVMRSLGLEWLYRLAREPTRVRRQVLLAQYVALHLTGRL